MASQNTLLKRLRQAVQDDDFDKINNLIDSIEEASLSSGPTLGQLMANQRSLMDVLGIASGPVDDVATSVLFKDVVIMMMSECIEMLNPLTTSTKPWKQIDIAQVREEVTDEMIDLLFFVLELFELSGLSASQIAERYEEKRAKNFARVSQSSISVAIMSNKLNKDQQDSIVDRVSEILGKIVGAQTRMMVWSACSNYEQSKDKNKFKTFNEEVTYALVGADNVDMNIINEAMKLEVDSE